MRWEDDMKRHAGLTWKWQPQNRDVWNEIGETYIRKWIEEVWKEEEEEEEKITSYMDWELSPNNILIKFNQE